MSVATAHLQARIFPVHSSQYKVYSFKLPISSATLHSLFVPEYLAQSQSFI